MNLRYAFVFMLFASICSDVSAKPLDKNLLASRPNIILVMTDDQGLGDLSFTGNELLNTPNIDSFATNAVRFNDFQVSPTCAPTRAALMSGLPPFKVGVTHTIFQRERLAPDVYTMPQALQSAGYQTGLFGKWHLGDEPQYLPQARGFDEVLMHGAGGIGQTHLGDFPPNKDNLYFDNVLLHNDKIVQTKGFCTDVFFSAALAWIKKQHSAKQPYFAYVSLNAPHAPYIAPESYKKRFLEAGYDQKTAGRYGMIENIDDNVGRLMSKLDEWGALDNTLIIFMTDNGMSMPPMVHNGKQLIPFNAGLKGRKNSAYQGGTKVPMYWQWKGVLDKNIDINGLTAHIDLYPTLTQLAGATLPENMQQLDGRSLIPLLNSPKAQWDDRKLFIHIGRWKAGEMEAAKYGKYAVRTQQWRFVNNKELYDVNADHGESQNLASMYPKVVNNLRNAYEQWWDASVPLMINEGLPKVEEADFPLVIRYNKQLKETGIPFWSPNEL
ncbi:MULTISPECIES: arylsulfatase [Aliiglaciecola]|uniref:arylsulfatase n=1 Tax=Aliiglaciecola TaxID=1406885 RepID=UPI001C0907C8|nr:MULTISPECIES: arylsulfatase [Aliiglaciecola]MBU2877920.1 arylsulfatase [Aliiglaciecola lipolytica]MDO6709284.1 arylsulfatase [Aliiglaciecola sp. 2_MG-2023]MDO6750432.1 arylsulfatase [Aliiglaciecola sp. 1_MG-2023]